MRRRKSFARRAFRAAARRYAPFLIRAPKKETWGARMLVRRLEWTAGVSAAELRHLCRVRLERLRPVAQPLVLISQIDRSGGTLLSQLFDVHPECHAHPGELTIGYPSKERWPPLDPSDPPKRWFRMLFEPGVVKNFRHGYEKYGKGAESGFPTYPFLFPPTLQKEIFRRAIASRPARSPRDILDAYMTSFFNAWLDNQNLYVEPKRFVTAFVPRMSSDPRNVEQFFSVYPDGRLIGIVRDPTTWFMSYRVARPAFQDPRRAIPNWVRSTDALVEAKGAYGERVRLLAFEPLLRDTAGTMRGVAEWLGIEVTAGLLRPTFNGLPILADSSFAVPGHGVLEAPLHRAEAGLTDDERRYIEETTARSRASAARVMS